MLLAVFLRNYIPRGEKAVNLSLNGAYHNRKQCDIAMHAWLSARGTYPLLGAILYMLAPYHLYNFHVRGALAEFAALVWLPLIALGIERLPHRRGLLLLALSYGGLIITYLPLAVLTGVFLIGPLMLRRIWLEPRAFLPGALAVTCSPDCYRSKVESGSFMMAV